MTTKDELDAMRPTACPNFGTRRTCGKAYNSGCRHDMCVIPYNEKKRLKMADGAPRTRTTKAGAVGPRQVFVGGFPEKDKSHSENWTLHDACCSGSKVWRPKSFGCIPA